MILIELLLLLVGFFSLGEANTIYIESYHLSYDNGYKATFLSLSSKGILGEGGDNYIANTEGNTITECVDKLDGSLESKVDMYHVSSVILDPSMLQKKPIEEFMNEMKDSDEFNFNFNIYISADKACDLYQYQNPDDSSSYFSILDVSNENKYLFNYVAYLHYTSFVANYYENNVILAPSLKSERIWDKPTLTIDGLYYIKGSSYTYYASNINPILCFLNRNSNISYKDTKIKDYKMKKSYKEQLIITLKGKIESGQKEDYKAILYEAIINDKNDLLDLNKINRCYKKQYKKEDILIIDKIN